jgi:hypothetical protein
MAVASGPQPLRGDCRQRREEAPLVAGQHALAQLITEGERHVGTVRRAPRCSDASH